MNLKKVQEFVSTFSPLYFEDCDWKYRKDVEKEYKIKINHSVKRKDENDILGFLENAKQDIKTIKWKLGVDINCSDSSIKTRYKTFKGEKLISYCKSTNNKAGEYDYSNEGILDTYKSLCDELESNSITGFGSVNIINSMFFLSGGEVPIYDYYANAAVKALLYNCSPTETYIPEAPGRYDHPRNAKEERLAVNLLREYKLLLHEVFGEAGCINQSGMYISRDLDRALWVYGHAAQKWEGYVAIVQSSSREYEKEIYRIAEEFRNAIEDAQHDGGFDNDITMKNFPRGCCGDAADLLGEYLLHNGIGNLYYVCGTYYPDTGDDEKDFLGKQSHAWISIDNPIKTNSLIVDITGDQFKCTPEFGCYNLKVYVGGTDSFHSLFSVMKTDIYKYTGIKNYGIARERLSKLYSEIIKWIHGQ